MGGINSMLEKMPGVGNLKANLQDSVNDKMFTKMETIINSMTPFERRKPECIKSSRKQRIASGSGTTAQDINRLLKQFMQMQKMMKSMKKKGGLKNMMAAMQGGGNHMPGIMHPGKGGKFPF